MVAIIEYIIEGVLGFGAALAIPAGIYLLAHLHAKKSDQREGRSDIARLLENHLLDSSLERLRKR